jgi:cold shock CspA family protein
MSRHEGEVLWFNKSKGIGEIVGSDGRRFLAHYEQIESTEQVKNLDPGQKVSFELIKNRPFKHLDHLDATAKKIKAI